MSQNLVIPNKDNKVVFVFTGIDLTLSSNVVIVFGAETYSTALTPTLVTIDSATQLSLDLSATSEVGQVFATITYFDGGSTNGTDITSQELGNSGQIIVAIGTQLTVEDGSIVTGANSFVTDTELKAYANLRGLSVPATQPEREALLVKAMDFINCNEKDMQGRRVSSDQLLSFPRIGVWVNDFFIDSTEIPATLKDAQCEAAIASQTINLLTNETVDNIQSKKLDGLAKSYFKGGNKTKINIQRVWNYLDPLLVDVNTLVRT